ncbi:type VI secretion system baseplate subunit TssF, partial [Erwinia sp. MYb416]
VGCKSEPVIRRIPGDGLLVYGRGVRCMLTVDEEGFSGISPYLFGLIMENYLARHAAINIFTETELHSMQRGLIARWGARPGRRGAL